MKKTTALLLTVFCMGLLAGSVNAATEAKKIALSNNYAGNSWRQAMLKSWDKVTSKAISDGVVAEAPAFTCLSI